MKKSLLTFFLAPFFMIYLAHLIYAAEGEMSLIDLNRNFLEERRSTIEWGRDPFILPVKPASIAPINNTESDDGKALSLSAVIYREGEGTAIVNHRIVRKGDHVEGMIVDGILPDRIFLKSGSKVIELKVENFVSK